MSHNCVTIQKVENQSHRIWRYQRFLLVTEYYNKPPLPPPFNIASETLVMNSIDSNENNIREKFKLNDVMQRESAIAAGYLNHTLKHGKKNHIEVALQNIERRLHDLHERIHNDNQVLSYDQQWFSPDA
ncbi:unnamed protein product [Rotaria sordida]|uniref:Uncharacterized protein n=1 Tax=Rotaria sordida TaxID=392033 RepID=A0A814J9T6_9BILA|nr:unnamed protein product [Rotaria sordida]CAF1174770.1 unnamed protein product [Rotaria sordida]